MNSNKNITNRYTPLGILEDGSEKPFSGKPNEYKAAMDAIILAAIKEYHPHASIRTYHADSTSLSYKPFDSPTAECFANTDWTMRGWLISHPILTETVRRKKRKNGLLGQEAITVGYTDKERTFVIVSLFETSGPDYSIGTWSITDEFWVEEDTLKIHPMHLHFQHY